MDTKPPPKPRRTLTDEQLGKKRRIDKLKHRENRAENKTRLENIERDVSFLRDTIGDLLLQLRQLNHNPAPQQQPPPHHHHQPHHRQHHDAAAVGPSSASPHHLPLHDHALADQLMCLPKTEPWNSPDTASSSASITSSSIPMTTTTAPPTMAQVGAAFYNPADHLTERLYTQHIFQQEPPFLEAQLDMEALLADIRGQGPVVECRCGKPHQSEVQCTERITVIMAVEFNNVSNHTSLRAMTAPRDPSLPDMLLHHTEMSNPLAAIISSILRQYEVTHVDTLCGIFLLVYRLLRVCRFGLCGLLFLINSASY